LVIPFLHRGGDALVGARLSEQSPRLWSNQDRSQQMNTIKSIVFILALCSLCSEAVLRTYRHFNPPVAIVVR
jgi:hypothetical protein